MPTTSIMSLVLVLISAIAGTNVSRPCCSAHENKGCDDEECRNFVCNGDKFCCTKWWSPACANAASVPGVMEKRNRWFHPRDSLETCTVCRVPPPPPSPLSPPQPPAMPPMPHPPVPSSIIQGGSVCVGFRSELEQQRAISDAVAFRAGVARHFGIWQSALTLPSATFGCECGTHCTAQRCSIARLVQNVSMVSVAPAVLMQFLVLPHSGDPSLVELCNSVRQANKGTDAHVRLHQPLKSPHPMNELMSPALRGSGVLRMHWRRYHSTAAQEYHQLLCDARECQPGPRADAILYDLLKHLDHSRFQHAAFLFCLTALFLLCKDVEVWA